MRRLATLSCTLLLTGCGLGHFIGDTVTLPGANPNSPQLDSENMRRVRALSVEIQPIETEPGNVWPGKQQPAPTLEDIQREQDQQNAKIRANAPKTVLPFTIPTPGVQPNAPGPSPTGPSANGTVLLPNGQGTVTGGTNTYRTLTTPGGGGNSIIIPNGNGTSTVIGPTGTVTTVPTPR